MIAVLEQLPLRFAVGARGLHQRLDLNVEQLGAD